MKRLQIHISLAGITREVTPGMEWVLDSKGKGTVKADGSCCTIIDGNFCKRYDAKHGVKKAVSCAFAACITVRNLRYSTVLIRRSTASTDIPELKSDGSTF